MERQAFTPTFSCIPPTPDAEYTDKEKVKLCSQILLERYINPDVQGG